MMKIGKCLLNALLLASWVMVCATAEADGALLLDIDADVAEIQQESNGGIVIEDDGLALQDAELAFDDAVLPVIGDTDALTLDVALYGPDAATSPEGDALPNDASTGDFEIDGTTLVKYKGSADKVVIPYGVTTIGEGAFKYCFDMISVTIPDSVTSIGKEAFSGCDGLTRN